MEVGEVMVKEEVLVVPTLTVVAPVKPVPVRVITVPPLTGPEDGWIMTIVGP